MDKRNYIVVLLLSLLSIFSSDVKGAIPNTQNNNTADIVVTGTILNNTGEPIAFASISIENSKKGVIADNSGTFQISTKSNEVLLISHLGYSPKRIKIEEYRDQNPIHINTILEPSALMLDDVVVVGHTKSKMIEREGFSVSSIDTKALQAKSIETNAILNQTAGVKVRQDGGLGSRTSYNINGLTGSSIRIFIDGIPMEQLGESFSLSSLPISMIERIDVYKGVVPIELGNDALGGAINIVTKRLTTNTIDLSYSAGSFNTHRANIGANLVLKKSGATLRVNGFYNYSDNSYKVWSDDVILIEDDSTSPDFGSIERGITATRFNDDYKSYGANVQIGIVNKSWTDNLLIGINSSYMEREHQHGATMMVPYGERKSNDKMFTPMLNYNKNNFIVDGLDTKIHLSYSGTETTLIDTTMNTYNWLGEIVSTPNPTAGEGQSATLNSDNNNTYLARSSFSYRVDNRHEVGVNYIYSNFSRSSDDPTSVPAVRLYGTKYRIEKQIIGINLQKSTLNNNIKGSIFAKYYGNGVGIDKAEYDATTGVTTPFILDDFSSSWGYGTAAIFKISPTVRLNFSAEKAIRLPGPDEIFGDVSSNVVPSYDIKPENSNNINIGTELSLLHNRESSISIQANLFYRDTKDKLKRILGESGGEKDMYIYENFGRTLSKGVDLKVKYTLPDHLDITAYGSYLDSRFKDQYDQYGNVYLHYNAREPNTPYVTSGLDANYYFANPLSKGGELSIGWSSSYVYKFFLKWETYGDQGKATIPTQFINNCNISYHLSNRKASISLDGKNIFNKLAFDNYAIQKPGRAIYAKISYRLQ